MTPTTPETPKTPEAEASPLLKIQPLAEDGPGAGGWTPGKNTPIFVAVFCGIAGAVGPVLMMPEPKWNVILASVLSGAGTALAGYLGIRSAGPRQP